MVTQSIVSLYHRVASSVSSCSKGWGFREIIQTDVSEFESTSTSMSKKKASAASPYLDVMTFRHSHLLRDGIGKCTKRYPAKKANTHLAHLCTYKSKMIKYISLPSLWLHSGSQTAHARSCADPKSRTYRRWIFFRCRGETLSFPFLSPKDTRRSHLPCLALSLTDCWNCIYCLL